jgi:hypothetical protein
VLGPNVFRRLADHDRQLPLGCVRIPPTIL